MPKKLKAVPRFRTESEERAFWESHDTADYFDLSKAQRTRFAYPRTCLIASRSRLIPEMYRINP
jgi:hypothetical protein